ncbi:hypothetical protein GHT06_017035 [Daphnia sinensis]|uniref:Uncharacterized protein n=1 Tax=Daphnia sinensis TaxID=1820382 RepID=A0AAD5KPB0_9CRUS|nr:hypothetical protein GHT06_017035 [Daphnia sinensis]
MEIKTKRPKHEQASCGLRRKTRNHRTACWATRTRTLFDKLRNKGANLPYSREVAVDLFDISNRPLICQGTLVVNVLVEDERPREPFQQEFIVVQGIMEECVLGLDALYQHDFVIDGRERRVYRAKESDQLQNVDQPIMMAASRLKIPPSSACLMESGNSGFKLSPDTTWRVAFRPCARVASCANKPSNLPPDFLEASLPDVAEDVKDSLRNLLLANQHVFAFKTSDLGNTGLVKHVIDTQGLVHIRQRPYRASPHQKEASKKIIEELLANNIIRPSISP